MGPPICRPKVALQPSRLTQVCYSSHGRTLGMCHRDACARTCIWRVPCWIGQTRAMREDSKHSMSVRPLCDKHNLPMWLLKDISAISDGQQHLNSELFSPPPHPPHLTPPFPTFGPQSHPPHLIPPHSVSPHLAPHRPHRCRLSLGHLVTA